MFEFYHFDIQHTGKVSQWRGVCVCRWCACCRVYLRVCAYVCACACVPSVPVFGSLLQAPSLVSHWNIALGISVLSLFPKFSPPEAFTRVNRYRRRGIEHQKHSTMKQTLSKQGCDYNKTLPCRHYAFHKRADTVKFKADKMSQLMLVVILSSSESASSIAVCYTSATLIVSTSVYSRATPSDHLFFKTLTCDTHSLSFPQANILVSCWYPSC